LSEGTQKVYDDLMLQKKIVATAREWIGTPFAWGCSEKSLACDCAGLVLGVGKEVRLLPERLSIPPYGRGVDAETLLKHLEEHLEKIGDGFLSINHFTKSGSILVFKPRRQDALHLAILTAPPRFEYNKNESKIENIDPVCIHSSEKAGKVVEESLNFYTIESVWRYKK
jgi:cell wall-associated NlpC family hydrolase